MQIIINIESNEQQMKMRAQTKLNLNKQKRCRFLFDIGRKNNINISRINIWTEVPEFYKIGILYLAKRMNKFETLTRYFKTVVGNAMPPLLLNILGVL